MPLACFNNDFPMGGCPRAGPGVAWHGLAWRVALIGSGETGRQTGGQMDRRPQKVSPLGGEKRWNSNLVSACMSVFIYVCVCVSLCVSYFWGGSPGVTKNVLLHLPRTLAGCVGVRGPDGADILYICGIMYVLAMHKACLCFSVFHTHTHASCLGPARSLSGLTRGSVLRSQPNSGSGHEAHGSRPGRT